MLPLRKEKIKWSAELAYAVGLIATDGCLSSDGRHLDFTSKDIQLLETFKKCLALKNKIGVKSSGSSTKKYYHVQFGDIVLYKWLLELGLTPHKSKSIGKLKIFNKYFFDFLRGCFDGDGTIYSYWDPRWRSSFMFYIAFASGSLNFLKWLQKKNKKIGAVGGYIGHNSNNTFILRYAKKESLILFKKMFYSKNIPYLERKFKKAMKIFEINAKHNK